MPMAAYKDHVPNTILYKDTPCLSAVLRARRLQFAGHCARSNQPVADLVFWRADGPYKPGQGNIATYLRTLEADMPGVKTKELVRVSHDRDS